MKIGIIGAGWIAAKMARTLKGMDGCEGFAIASRSLERAQQFAAEWGFERAYGSCDALINGWTEHPDMPLDETMEVMRLMDCFRKDCGVVYPMD